MKNRGFTLIELLIVTVVIAILMAIVFRLAGTGSESKARAETISRLQKLSNALSGYYAAFGSYPPVPLQGRSRDISTPVDGSGAMGYGIQAADGESPRKPSFANADKGDGLDWNQIEAACRAQPVAAGFPINSYEEHFEQKFFNEYNKVYNTHWSTIKDYGGFNRDSVEWSENNLFMFGLLSFLLPRYQFMLDGEKNMYYDRLWNEHNRRPYLMNGKRLDSWELAQESLQMGREHWNTKLSDGMRDTRTMIEQLPSQAVCARWMPNFEGIVLTRPFRNVHSTFFGVNTEYPVDHTSQSGKWLCIGQKGHKGGKEKDMVNGTKSVIDGWGEDFYYYSLPPYQSYQLWSSGPNKRTFPPWIDKSSLSQNEINYVNKWVADDIKVGDK